MRWLSLLIVLLTSFVVESPVHSCAAAPPPGARVEVAGESAIIVWDARTQMEHFIRRAAFNSNADNFGFLVPTPTPPKLTAADDITFELLEATYRPHFVRRPVYGLKLASITTMFVKSRGREAGPGSSAPEDVAVLNAQHVAGYDAVTLRADDAAALTGWLQAHGYAARPALTDWLRPYVAKHWAITAFKISRPDASMSQYGSSAVRMSFTTPRPFFPYSEPTDQRTAGAYAGNRLLRLFLLSNARMDGALDGTPVRWPVRIRWAQTPPYFHGDLSQSLQQTLGLTESQMPSPLWLTVFEDQASPRPGIADLYFQPAAQQTPVVPTPVEWPIDERIGIPIELVVFILTLVVLSVITLRRRARVGRA